MITVAVQSCLVNIQVYDMDAQLSSKSHGNFERYWFLQESVIAYFKS